MDVTPDDRSFVVYDHVVRQLIKTAHSLERLVAQRFLKHSFLKSLPVIDSDLSWTWASDGAVKFALSTRDLTT
jgi:hypothetical protein